MSGLQPIRNIEQALQREFPKDNEFLTRRLLAVVDEFGPSNVVGFRSTQNKYFNSKIRQCCRKIWSTDWPSSINRSNRLVEVVTQLVKARCYNRFPTPRGQYLKLFGTPAEKALIAKTERRLVTGVDSSGSEYEDSGTSDADSSGDESDRQRRHRQRRGMRTARARRVQSTQASRRRVDRSRLVAGISTTNTNSDRPEVTARVVPHRFTSSAIAEEQSSPKSSTDNDSGYGKSRDTSSSSQHNVHGGRQSTPPTTLVDMAETADPEPRPKHGLPHPGSENAHQENVKAVCAVAEAPVARRLDPDSQGVSAVMQQAHSSDNMGSDRVIQSQTRSIRSPSVVIDEVATLANASRRRRAEEWALYQHWLVYHGTGYDQCAFGDHGPYALHGFASSVDERDGQRVVGSCLGTLAYESQP